MEKTNIQCGSFNEGGFINSLKRKGFNFNRSISELIQNCIDSGATMVKFIKIDDEEFILMDNGKGMKKLNLIHMWDAYRENHSDDESGGVSGLGCKPSTLILSEQTDIIVLTKFNNDEYYKATVPWTKIVKENKYSEQVVIEKMNEEEIKKFKLYLNDNSGTLLIFKYNHHFYDCLKSQFYESKKIDDITQRIDWIFAKFPAKISFIDNDKETIAEKYDYFSAHENEFYIKNKFTFEVFKMNDENIVYALKEGENQYSHFIKNARGWQLNNFISYRQGIKLGTMILDCGLRKDKEYFNYIDPKYNKSTESLFPGASKILMKYDKEYFSNGKAGENSGDEIKKSLWFPHLTRNSQNIGIIQSLLTLNPASGRASGKLCLQNNYIRTNISYEVNSNQGNIMDELMGIQENKNQLNSHNMDHSLLRLIEDCMKNTSNDIWNYFKKIINDKEERINQEKIKKIQEQEKERIEKIKKFKEQELIKKVFEEKIRKEKEEENRIRKEKEEEEEKNLEKEGEGGELKKQIKVDSEDSEEESEEDDSNSEEDSEVDSDSEDSEDTDEEVEELDAEIVIVKMKTNLKILFEKIITQSNTKEPLEKLFELLNDNI
jgi:hypothetical protein